MSREIDERVVQMKFEKGQFEKDIQTSIYKLDELKKGMDFKDAVKGFEDLDKAARTSDISALGKAVEQVQIKFSMLEIFALRVMTRISDAAINAGEKLVKSLTIDQITPGWDKYAQKTSSVQTIMAATAAQFDNTATQMEVVNEQLNKLNWFTDETSYNFVDMVNNIGKFTSNNIALDQSVTAMQGIANWAAISGANAQEASRAMYNLAQALATGTVKLIDWKSIENANMATTEFKQTVIDIATELGTLKKVGEDTWTTIDGKTQVSVANFNEGLSKGWFTNEVLMRGLNKYGAAVEKINEVYEKLGAEVTTSRIVKSIDDYTAALANARAEAEGLGLSADETAQKAAEAGRVVAEEVADSWGVSLEEATEMLAQFDDETMQFGLKAFKAAQEAKTFQEAIDSVKDAVSTGWMKTFELLFGSYTEAKELWTNLANTLYDIFATSGDLRNEMLEEWADEGGRAYFTDTIYAGLAAIMSILAPIKAAWQAVFGKMTAGRLLDLTKKLHAFVLSLVQTEESMAKILRVFRGLFSVLDIIKTVVLGVAKGAFQVLQRVLKELNIDIGEFVASIGDGLYEIRNLVKGTNVLPIIFDKIGDALVWVIQQARSFINAIQDFGPIKAILDGLHQTFGEDFQGIGGVLQALGAIIMWLWGKLSNFKMPTSFSDVAQFFRNLAANIKENFESIGVDFTWLEETFNNFREKVDGTLGSVNDAFNKTRTLASGAVAYLSSFFRGVDWSGVLLTAFGVSTIATLWKFADAVTAVGKALQNVTGVGKSAKAALDSVSAYFKALKANIDTNNILKMAIALTGLAIAFGLFSRMSWDEVLHGAAAIGTLTVAMLVFIGVLAVMNKTNLKGKGLSEVVLSFSGAMLMLAVALKAIPADNMLDEKINALLKLILGFQLITVMASWFSKPAQIATTGLLAMTASIFLLIQIMKSIGEEDVNSIYAALPVVSALMLMLAAVSKLASANNSVSTTIGKNGFSRNKSGGSFGSIIAMALSMIILIKAIEKLGRMDFDTATKGIILSIPIVILLGQLFKASGKAGQYASSAGKMILFIAAGLAILIPVIKKFADMDKATLIKGGITITLLNVAVMVPLVALSKFAGKYAAKAGLMILEIAGALAILQLVVKTLGKADPVELTKGVIATGVLILSLSTVVAALRGLGKASEHNVKAMTKLMIIVGLISLLLLSLTIIDPSGALVAAIGIGAAFVSIGQMFKKMDKVQLPNAKTLAVMLGMIGMIGLTIGLIAGLTDWKSALAASAGISMVILALASVSQIIKNSATSTTLREKLSTLTWFAKRLAVFIGGLAIVAAAAKWLGTDINDVLILTTAMSEVLIALGIMGKLLGSMQVGQSRKIDEVLKLAVGVAGIIGIIATVLAIANRNGTKTDFTNLIAITTAMSELIIAMGLAVRLMSKQNFTISNDITGQIIALGIITTIMGSVLGIIANVMSSSGMKMTDMIIFATGVSELVVAMGLAVKIMGKTNFKIGVDQAASLGLLIAAISGALAYFSNMVNPEKVLPLAIGITPVLIALSAAAWILAHVPQGSLGGAIEGIGIVLLVIAGIAAIVGAMGWIVEVADSSTIFAKGAEAFGQIGRAIGGFFAGLYGGFGEGLASTLPAVCSYISQAMENLMPFFGYLHQLPGGVIELVGTLVGVVLAISATEFIAGLKMFPGIGTIMAAGAATIKTDFVTFGSALKGFYDEVKDIDADKVSKAAEAVVALGGMEQSMGSVGSIFSTLLGFDNFERFGERLVKLGEALVAFAETTAPLEGYSGVTEHAVTLAETLIALENGLPPKDGLFQKWFTGQDDFSMLGERLREFGHALVDFSRIMAVTNYPAIENSISAAKSLIELENTLEPVSLWKGIIFGKDNLGDFGQRLITFGGALFGFGESVKDIDLMAFSDAEWVTTRLTALEKNLEDHGGFKGFWFGDNTFKSFGSNLEKFGNSLLHFSATVTLVDTAKLYNAITWVRDLIGLQDLKFTQDDAIKAAKTILEDIKTTIDNNSKSVRAKGVSTIYWIAMGLQDGTSIHSQIVKNSAIGMANDFITAFEFAMQIHSPSLVMKEEGYYVAEGLAEGIDENTSPEDVAKKKAQNLVTAFNNEISKLTRQEKTSNLEFELWRLTDGKDATEVEIAQKQLEIENQKLANLAKTVGANKAAMEAIAEISGKDSQEYQEAYQNYLQSQIDMLNQQKSIDETYHGITEDSDTTLRSQMLAFQQYIKDNEEAYKFLGKSQEELEEAAYKAVYGLDAEQVARKKEYERLMREYGESFEQLGWTRDELDKFAKDKSGWEEIGKNALNTMTETSKIIADNIGTYQINMEETIEKATADAIANATKSSSSKSGSSGGGSAASVAAIAGGLSLGEDLQKSFIQGIESGTPDVITEGLDALDNVMSVWTGETNLLGNVAGKAFDQVFGAGVKEEVGEVVDGLYTAITEPTTKHLGDATEYAEQAGKDFTTGFAKGLTNANVMQTLNNAINQVVNKSKELKDKLDERSPSRLSAGYGAFFTQGFANGIISKIGIVETAVEELASTASDPLAYAAQAVNEILNSDGDFEPVITPVLDLDELEKQASGIHDLLNSNRTISVDGARIRAAQIASSKSESVNQNGSINGSGQTNYNFVQNNYSPKALSRAEIYRQTNNQFSRIKEATKR